VIITRTPLRVSLGGGGTDLPSYYRRFGGLVVSAAITKYIYVAINRTFTDDYLLKYAAMERVTAPHEIEHPVLRAALTTHEVGPAVEIVSLADIPSGTGLGSSGSFTVGLLRALYAFRRNHIATDALAEEACSIEIDQLSRTVGKQDQYIAAFGGITCFQFNPDDTVEVSPVAMSVDTLHDLQEHLLLFFTGYSRDAESMLVDQHKRSDSADAEMLENLHATKDLGLTIKKKLEQGEPRAFGELMHEHWLIKRRRSAGMTSADIDRWYETAMDNGAVGGKLVGAGGGGFLMFYADDQDKVRSAMSAAGLTEVRFDFDHDGSQVLVRA
jgi:D-glycero-alpha-D-manno-heptose-7-phosphate kinase